MPPSMAASSSNTTTAITLMSVSEKLTCSNHTLWRVQVLAVLRGVQLAGFLDGTNKAPAETMKIKKPIEKSEEIDEVPNPAFKLWKA
jgi:hypothetical protein